MDVIGRDAPVRRPLPPWLADRRSVAVGVAALLTAAAGVLAVPRTGASVPAPGEVGVVFDGAESTASGEGASGALQLQVVNRSSRAVAVTGLTLVAGGLDVLVVQPEGRPARADLEAFGQRRYVVRYVVADCGQLRLPGTVRLSVAAPGGPPVRREVALDLPTAAGDGVPFAPCRAPQDGASLSARTVGGAGGPAGDGARGQALVQLVNDGPSVLLLGVSAEVPGVRFTPVELPNGVPLRQGRRVELQLDFVIDDCRRLRRTGRLVVRTSSGGVVTETGLPLTNDGEARTLRDADLDLVLQACPR